MALRLPPKRVCAALRAPRINCVSTRFASAAAAALKGSNLPQHIKDSIEVRTATRLSMDYLANV